jgi:hypothetical protein
MKSVVFTFREHVAEESQDRMRLRILALAGVRNVGRISPDAKNPALRRMWFAEVADQKAASDLVALLRQHEDIESADLPAERGLIQHLGIRLWTLCGGREGVRRCIALPLVPVERGRQQIRQRLGVHFNERRIATGLRVVRRLLRDPRSLGLGLRKNAPEPIRLLVHRLLVHPDDGGTYRADGAYNARAHGADGGRTQHFMSGVGRGGSRFAMFRLVRHARLLMFLPDLKGSLGLRS